MITGAKSTVCREQNQKTKIMCLLESDGGSESLSQPTY